MRKFIFLRHHKKVLGYTLIILSLLILVQFLVFSFRAKDARRLCEAIENGNTEAVRNLLREGTYANGMTHSVLHIPLAIILDGDFPTTPLKTACSKGNAEAVKLLLEHGADPDKHIYGDYTCIGEVYASPEGVKARFEIIPLLLSYGADVTQTGHGQGKNHGAFLEAANEISEQTNSYETVEQSVALIAMMTEIPAYLVNGYGTTLLGETRNENVAAWLVEQGADINATNKYGNTPLICAIMRGDADMAAFLLDCGAKVNIVNKDGETAYDIAVALKQRQIAEWLIRSTGDGSVC